MSLNRMMVVGSTIIAATAMAAALTLEQVNTKMSQLVAPFNNQTTQVSLVFTDLLADAQRALKFGVDFSYAKQGLDNKVEIKLDEIRYDYDNGVNPRGQARLSIQTDLVKAFGQPTVNGMGEALGDLAKDFVSGFGEKYGDALSVEAKTSNLVRSEKGDIRSISIELNAAIDFSKLPANVSATEIEVRNFKLVANLNTQGIAARLIVGINPSYKGFKTGEFGMKEMIEKIVSEDQQSYKDIQQLLAIADMFITNLLEKKN